MLILFKIMIIFNNTSADFVLILVENDHNFEQNEDRATVILKWTDFNINIFSNFSSYKSFSRSLGQLFLTLGLKQFLKQNALSNSWI